MLNLKDPAIDRHFSLLRSLLPDLSASSAVAFGLLCFARQIELFADIVAPADEFPEHGPGVSWLDFMRNTHEDWWDWCEVGQRRLPKLELQDIGTASLEKTRSQREQVAYAILTNFEGLFSEFEGGDYWYARYSAGWNTHLLEGLEDDVDATALVKLLYVEVETQERELTALVDGAVPRQMRTTRSSQRLFGAVSWSGGAWRVAHAT